MNNEMYQIKLPFLCLEADDSSIETNILGLAKAVRGFSNIVMPEYGQLDKLAQGIHGLTEAMNLLQNRLLEHAKKSDNEANEKKMFDIMASIADSIADMQNIVTNSVKDMKAESTAAIPKSIVVEEKKEAVATKESSNSKGSDNLMNYIIAGVAFTAINVVTMVFLFKFIL